MKAIGKQLKGYFAMFVVQFSSGYITVQGGTPLLVGFTDSDCVGDPDDWKATVGYVFSLGSGPVTWAYKKQQAIALSSESRVLSSGKCKSGSPMASTDPFRVWIPSPASDQPLV
jgi:hypothetical protein